MELISEQRPRIFRLLAALVFLLVLLASGVEASAGTEFSFLVVGDTRTEPYLTGGPEQSAAMVAVLKKRYGDHGRPVRLYFDPSGTELARAEVWESADTLLTLFYRDGWPHTIVRANQGQPQVIMRDSGRKWVCNRIISSIKRGTADPSSGALFLVHGGDIPLFGYQGATLDESPYWQLFDDELLSRLPPPDASLGLPARVLAAVGNHETWEDETISGFLTAMPRLHDLGLSAERRMYSLSFRNCRFIFLDSGGYSSTGEAWAGRYPPFPAQMSFLTSELELAKTSGADHVFVIYHKPSFVKIGHDPLPEGQNPHEFIKPFARDLSIFVLNSHTHTTEHYLLDGVHYLVLGAGGAPQKFDPAAHPSPEKELYWQDQGRGEEYSYLQVTVAGHHIQGMIHRFRPTDTERPVSTVEVFRK